MDAVKDGEHIPLGNHGCFDHPPFHKSLEVPDGWAKDGRKKWKEIPFVMSEKCEYDDPDDPRCSGCQWKAA